MHYIMLPSLHYESQRVASVGDVFRVFAKLSGRLNKPRIFRNFLFEFLVRTIDKLFLLVYYFSFIFVM